MLNAVQFKSENGVFRTQSIPLIITRRKKKKVIQGCKFQWTLLLIGTELVPLFWITVTSLLEYLFHAFRAAWAEQLFSEPIRFSFELVPWVQYILFLESENRRTFYIQKDEKVFIKVWGHVWYLKCFKTQSVKVQSGFREGVVFSFLCWHVHQV